MRSITLPHPSEWRAFPCIYQPVLLQSTGRRRFAVTAPVELLSDIPGVRVRESRVSIHSWARPEVSAKEGIDWLVRQLARADARNITRDEFLAEQRLRVWFEPVPFNVPGEARGTSLQLKKVEIL